MARRTRLLVVESGSTELPIQPDAASGTMTVNGVGETGFGRLTGIASLSFSIESLTQALVSNFGDGFGFAGLDTSLAVEFAPDAGAPAFDPVIVAGSNSSTPVFVGPFGSGVPFTSIQQTVGPLAVPEMTMEHLREGFGVALTATGLNAATFDGVPTIAATPINVVMGFVTILAEVTVRTWTKDADRVDGTPRHDSVALDRGNDIFRGLDGNDWADGGRGDDRLYGGHGADELLGDAGDDLLRGGHGDDALRGGSGADRLHGDGGDDVLSGGRGADRLYGGDGDDRLLGGVAGDTLFGGAGDDRLFGGDGADVLVPGPGDDTLRGGAGADLFDFRVLDGQMVVEDFDPASDRLRFSPGDEAGLRELAGRTVDGDVMIFDDSYSITFIGISAVDDLIAALV
jgi:hypothetical protein